MEQNWRLTMPKLNCKNCKQKCCEGYLINNITHKQKVILPKRVNKICVDGIQLVRVNRVLWKCRFLKRGKCSSYENRPWVCKYWYCLDNSQKQKYKRFFESTQNNSILGFAVISKGRQ